MGILSGTPQISVAGNNQEAKNAIIVNALNSVIELMFIINKERNQFMKDRNTDSMLSMLTSLQKQFSSNATAVHTAKSTHQEHKIKVKLKPIPDSWILVLTSGVAGLQFHDTADPKTGARLLNSLTPGTELRLVRDSENEHDFYAIEIYTQEGNMLGYVTRYKNETIARLMDAGKKFHAFVDKPITAPDDPRNMERFRTPTENFELPYSIYMEDDGYPEEYEDCGEEI